jgi:hypothetical protein
MNNDTSGNDPKQGEKVLSSGSPAVAKAKKKANKPKNADSRANSQKKTLGQLWRNSSALKRLEIILLAVVAFIGIPALGINACQVWQNHSHFVKEHQPTVVFLGFIVNVLEQQRGIDFVGRMQDTSETEATNFEARCDPYINSAPIDPKIFRDRTLPHKPINMGPHIPMIICGGNILTTAYKEVLDGSSVFVVYVHATYDGPATHHSYCEIEEFVPHANAFADVGTCDASKPLPQ